MPANRAHVIRRGDRRRRDLGSRRRLLNAMPQSAPSGDDTMALPRSEGGRAHVPQTEATCTQPKRSGTIDATTSRREPARPSPDRQKPPATALPSGRRPSSKRQMKITRFVISMAAESVGIELANTFSLKNRRKRLGVAILSRHQRRPKLCYFHARRDSPGDLTIKPGGPSQPPMVTES